MFLSSLHILLRLDINLVECPLKFCFALARFVCVTHPLNYSMAFDQVVAIVGVFVGHRLDVGVQSTGCCTNNSRWCRAYKRGSEEVDNEETMIPHAVTSWHDAGSSDHYVWSGPDPIDWLAPSKEGCAQLLASEGAPVMEPTTLIIPRPLSLVSVLPMLFL